MLQPFAHSEQGMRSGLLMRSLDTNVGNNLFCHIMFFLSKLFFMEEKA